jgi:response regulator of citrate/malate metabolism
MEQQIYILIVEDELEVMDALVNDLEEFEQYFPIETANNSEEAHEVVDQIVQQGAELGLILCDHVLPGENGVDFLISLQDKKEFRFSRKVLVTGQAGLEDTIQAINRAHLHHYIAKPWKHDDLRQVVIDQLTDYVINNRYNPLDFMHILDGVRLADFLRDNSLTDN